MKIKNQNNKCSISYQDREWACNNSNPCLYWGYACYYCCMSSSPVAVSVHIFTLVSQTYGTAIPTSLTFQWNSFNLMWREKLPTSTGCGQIYRHKYCSIAMQIMAVNTLFLQQVEILNWTSQRTYLMMMKMMLMLIFACDSVVFLLVD